MEGYNGSMLLTNLTNRPSNLYVIRIPFQMHVAYNTMYVLESNETATVEANPDPIGLKVGILYDVGFDKRELMVHLFVCKNDGVLNITEVKGDECAFYGYRGELRLFCMLRIFSQKKSSVCDRCSLCTCSVPPR
jgi:hypothetical protein